MTEVRAVRPRRRCCTTAAIMPRCRSSQLPRAIAVARCSRRMILHRHLPAHAAAFICSTGRVLWRETVVALGALGVFVLLAAGFRAKVTASRCTPRAIPARLSPRRSRSRTSPGAPNRIAESEVAMERGAADRARPASARSCSTGRAPRSSSAPRLCERRRIRSLRRRGRGALEAGSTGCDHAPPPPPDPRPVGAPGQLALAAGPRRGAGGRGGQGRRLRPRRARSGRGAGRGRLPRLFRLDLGGSRGARADAGGAARRASRRRPGRRRRRSLAARPVLNSVEQVARWKEIAPEPAVRRDGRHRHEPARAARRRDRLRSTGSTIDTLHSHLACADEDSAMNAMQLERFRGGRGGGPGEALQPRQFAPASVLAATTASTSSGPAWRFTAAFRAPKPTGHIRQVARVEAQIVQRRTIRAGETCGYGATFTAHGRHRGRDPQHRLCRRLSARLLVGAARRSPANSRCRCSAGCRWT